MVGQLKAEGRPTLFLDGGDLLFGVPRLEGHPDADFFRARARLVARSLGRMDVGAVNVGRLDLAAGLRFVESLGKEAGVPWVSANLRRKGGSRPFPAFKVIPWGSGRAAVFGLLRPDPAADAALGVEVADPQRTVAELLRELPPVDAVFCLSNLGLPQEIELARRVPGLTGIVGGGSSDLLSQPHVVGRTLILHASDRGKFVGVVDFSGGAAGDGGPASYTHRLIPLDPAVGEDPEIASWVRGHKETESMQRQEPTTSAPKPTLSAKPSQTFLGSTVCRECHPAAYRVWLGTKHSRSYAALKGKEQEGGCPDCHASTLTRASGATIEPDVACEACHGAGGSHRGKGDVIRRPSQEVCGRCHRGFHPRQRLDRKIDYEAIRCDRKS